MFSGILRRVALVRTDVSEELRASIIRMTRIGELGTTANVPISPILDSLMMEPLSSFETSVLTRVTRRNIPVDAILLILLSSYKTKMVEVKMKENMMILGGKDKERKKE
jgi:hypothetical protein